MTTFTPENEPAPSGSHDLKLVCHCDGLGLVGQPKARKKGAPPRGCSTCRLRGLSCRKQRFSILDRLHRKFVVPCLIQQVFVQDVLATIQKRPTETRIVGSLIQASVRILGHAIALYETHDVVAFEFFQHSSYLFGCFRVLCFWYPLVCSVIVSNPWCADALIARNANLP